MGLLLMAFLWFATPDSSVFELQNGDLIFQESCSDGVGNAIKEVTSSIDNYHFTHVGMVYIDDNGCIFVIEATHPQVSLTPIADYLYPKEKACYPRSVVGRLKEKYRCYIPQAIKEGLMLIGKEYDDGYILENDKYYCSELVYDILMKANNGNPVFELNVMTFKSLATGQFSQEWIDHFKRLDMEIPEGKLGINPGAMSQSQVIDIIYQY